MKKDKKMILAALLAATLVGCSNEGTESKKTTGEETATENISENKEANETDKSLEKLSSENTFKWLKDSGLSNEHGAEHMSQWKMPTEEMIKQLTSEYEGIVDTTYNRKTVVIEFENEEKANQFMEKEGEDSLYEKTSYKNIGIMLMGERNQKENYVKVLKNEGPIKDLEWITINDIQRQIHELGHNDTFLETSRLLFDFLIQSNSEMEALTIMEEEFAAREAIWTGIVNSSETAVNEEGQEIVFVTFIGDEDLYTGSEILVEDLEEENLFSLFLAEFTKEEAATLEHGQKVKVKGYISPGANTALGLANAEVVEKIE